MNLRNPHDLEKWSFYWSEMRLLIAAVALLLGGIPPVLLVFSFAPFLYGFIGLLLKLAWLLSGAAALYLGWRWTKAHQHLFGKKDRNDLIAFGVLVVSGVNLGLTGLLGSNIGMMISHNRFVFMLVAVLYLWAAWHLWTRWKSHGKHFFKE